MFHAKRFYFTLFFSLLSIVLMGTIPFAFNGKQFEPSKYITGLKELLTQLSKPSEIMYSSVIHTPRLLFPEIFHPYSYSITILFSAFFSAVALSIIFGIGISLLPSFLFKKIRFLTFLLESIPDILVAVTMQFFIVWFYKKTNVLLFSFTSSSDNHTYLMPIFCLMILPTILCLRILLSNIEEEWGKQYIETAKGKGLKRIYILMRHILPNTLLSLFYQSKQILWFMLSNLLVLELLFNIYGITNFVYMYGSPEVFTISVLLLFVPMFSFFIIGNWVIHKWVGDKE